AARSVLPAAAAHHRPAGAAAGGVRRGSGGAAQRLPDRDHDQRGDRPARPAVLDPGALRPAPPQQAGEGGLAAGPSRPPRHDPRASRLLAYRTPLDLWFVLTEFAGATSLGREPPAGRRRSRGRPHPSGPAAT